MKTNYYSILFILLILLGACQTEPKREKTLLLPGGIKMEFVFIPSGTFRMGSSENEEGRQEDEGPQHTVTISEGFYLGKYEVTQEQWSAIEKSNPSIFRHFLESPRHPVDWVSWSDCISFIKKLNQLGIGKFRLPTEAEWEYACRASSTTRYYWGNDPGYDQIHNFSWANSRAEGKSHPVGLKPPNDWGLYDMSGNVWEWCSDWFALYDIEDLTDPQGPDSGKRKVYRGGSWFNEPEALRCANRHGHPTNVKGTNSGLRLVLELN